jgi:hypothetical protein
MGRFLQVPLCIGIALSSCIWAPLDAAEDSPKPSLPKIRVATAGRGFVAGGKPFVPIGVTYYRPGTGWAPQVWKKFDAETTRGDFARMKALGVNCVRVFLSYGSFLMEPDALSPDGLAKFDRFLAIAEEAGIYVHPTGPDHWEGLPAWAAGDRIADERGLAALEFFWRNFAHRYRDRPVIFAYDLRNEPEVAWDTPAMRAKWGENRGRKSTSSGAAGPAHPARALPPPVPGNAPDDKQLLDYQHFREDLADEWTRRQAAAIKAVDPQALVTVGMIQWSVPALLPGLQHYSAFRPERQAKLLDFLEIHFYPLETGFYEYGGEEAEQRNLAYLESVVREVAAPGRPVVVAEFGWYGGKLTIDGGRHPASTEQQQARWCRRAVETTQGLATGWLNWGLYDHPEAKDVAQLTGLLTADGKTKTWGQEFQRLARSLAGQSLPAPRPGPRPALDWDRAITNMETGRLFRDGYYRAFRADRH